MGMTERLVVRFREILPERLGRLDADFRVLRDRVTDSATAVAVKREVHTIKGESRMAGFKTASQIAHDIECLLVGAGEGPLLSSRIQAALSGFRLIERLATLDPLGRHWKTTSTTWGRTGR